MSAPQQPDPSAGQHNSQQNNFGPGSTGYVNQGTQYNNTHIVNPAVVVPAQRNRGRIGWAVLTFVIIDVVYFFYGAAAYTGRQGDTGDLWRAGIFLVLAATTVSLVRRWFRRT
jgi:hypothetical protein